MTKAEAAKIKVGDRVKVKGGMWHTVTAISPYVNGLWTSKELAAKKNGWDGYLFYLFDLAQPVKHKMLESNKAMIKAKREALENELEERYSIK